MKNIKYFLFSLGLLLVFNLAKAQNDTNNSLEQDAPEENFWSHSKEVGLNFTPLISSLVPFNIGDKQSGLVGIKTKYYGINYAFRFTFGANLVGNSDNQSFHLGMGYERRRLLSKKFSYTSGWEGIIEALSTDANNARVTPFVGLAKFYGIEYNINDVFFIGTESQFAFGFSTTNNIGALLQFTAPTSIFLNVRLRNN